LIANSDEIIYCTLEEKLKSTKKKKKGQKGNAYSYCATYGVEIVCDSMIVLNLQYVDLYLHRNDWPYV